MTYDRSNPVLMNDSALVRRSRPTLERVMGAGNVVDLIPTTQAEDFAYFAREVPGFYFRLGTTKPGTVSGDHHTPTFMADDSAIPIGIRVMSSVLVDYLNGGAGR
jgi:amidohydrolase